MGQWNSGVITSCRRLVFLFLAAHHDLERVIGHGPLQRLGLFLWRAHRDVALLWGRQDHRRGFRVGRLDDRVRRRRCASRVPLATVGRDAAPCRALPVSLTKGGRAFAVSIQTH
jgi:hypothetical protein